MAAAKNIAKQSLDFVKDYWMPIAGCVGAYLLYNKFFGSAKTPEEVNYGIPSVDPETGKEIKTISDALAYAYAGRLYTAIEGLGTDVAELKAVYDLVKSDVFAVRKVYNAFTQVLKDNGKSGNLRQWLNDEYFFWGYGQERDNWIILLEASGI
jgi:hypothetical protein